LAQWYRLARKGHFENFIHLRGTFPSGDVVGKFTVFNIGGNKVRLIAAIHYNRGTLYIRHVLTHEEYDRGHWKKR
jgi:mRNA interferase HigB